MSPAKKLLIIGGIALTSLGMLYGVYYAVFVEHQTLDRIGGSLTASFAAAAQGDWGASEGGLVNYSHARYDYVRQVDVHSHWIGLAMLMIVLGIAFDGIRLGERARWWLSIALLAGSVIFPLGVILQTAAQGAMLGSALAIFGSALVIIALAAMAWGFARASF